jgi:SAM-dependent methyltransferase
MAMLQQADRLQRGSRSAHLQRRLASVLRPRHKMDFLFRLPPKFDLLDVGCGSNSPYLVKSLFPDCTYTGIDVSDYRQTKPNLADHYLLVEPSQFPEGILALGEKFDAVTSSHNLEHCDNRDATLESMMAVLKKGGRLYLSFPSGASVTFPSRSGCLNYYDDPTHKATPPDFDAIIELLSRNGFSILYSAKRYRSTVFWTLGLVSEPISRRRGRMRGTWEYYGFESIIWAEKTSE